MELERRFNDIYEQYSDAIFRFVYVKTRDRQQALDVTQDAFMKTWLYLADGNTINNARAFLYRTAYTTMLNALRKKQPLSLDSLSEEGWEPSDERPDPEASSIEHEEHREVMQHVGALPPHHRDVLLLRYVDNLSIQEIATILGGTENAISVRIHRAIEQLKKIYEH
ncbi:MAG: RNA polymerase sigma factor [Candidatus Campbellbacteria bacterium]